MFLILAINTKFLVFKNMSYFFCQKKILKFDFLSLFGSPDVRRPEGTFKFTPVR